MPYGLIYSARTVCIEHCLDVNHVCITVCEELNDDDDDDDDDRLLAFCDPVTFGIIGWRKLMMDYLCAKFGDFSFSRFRFIERKNRQNYTQTSLSALLARLSSACVNKTTILSYNLYLLRLNFITTYR